MVREAISGDRDGFRRLYETHADGVFRYLYRLAGNRHDAEDLLQDTFARLWRKRDQFRGDGSLAGYLRRIAYRTYLNARPRLEKRNGFATLDGVDPGAADPCPAERATRDDLERYLLAQVRRAVADLPDSLREPFVLFRFEGLMLREIAEILGITTKAAENRVARALQRVADKVEALRAEYGG